MLDDVVADHQVETLGREAISLDIAEDLLLRVVVVAYLVGIDVDHRDMRTLADAERQEAARSAAGFVDRELTGRQFGREDFVNRKQAVARLAGRQIQQRLRMRQTGALAR